MNHDADIVELKAKVEALEDTLMLVYDSINKRIDDMQDKRGLKVTIWGIVVAIVVGGIQIAIAYFAQK